MDNDINFEQNDEFYCFLKGLDNRSRAMFWCLLMKGHAELAELRDIAGFENDMDALMHIKDVFNPSAQDFFGRPALIFHSLRVNPQTGEKVLFNWWLDVDVLPAGVRKEPVVDLFEDARTVTVVAEVADILASSAEINYKNGILTIKLTKIQQKQEKLSEKHDISKEPRDFGDELRKADFKVQERLRVASRQANRPQPKPTKPDISTMKVAGTVDVEDLPTDIFDEGDCLVVILEIPEADEGNMQVDLLMDEILILTDSYGRELRQRVDLPCSVKRIKQRNYRNGILKIELEK